MTFAATLAAMRTNHSLSQRQLADLMGYSQGYIGYLEAGKRHPSRDTVLALATVLRLGDDDRAQLLIAAGYWPGHAAARAYLGIDDTARGCYTCTNGISGPSGASTPSAVAPKGATFDAS